MLLYRFFVTIFFVLSFLITSVSSKSLSFCTEQHKIISQTYYDYHIEKSCHKPVKKKTKEISCTQCDCYLLQVLLKSTDKSFSYLINNIQFCKFLVNHYIFFLNNIDPPPKNSLNI